MMEYQICCTTDTKGAWRTPLTCNGVCQVLLLKNAMHFKSFSWCILQAFFVVLFYFVQFKHEFFRLFCRSWREAYGIKHHKKSNTQDMQHFEKKLQMQKLPKILCMWGVLYFIIDLKVDCEKKHKKLCTKRQQNDVCETSLILAYWESSFRKIKLIVK